MFRGRVALQHQIHRREDARDVVRLVIGRGVGRAPQTLRHHAHRHHDRAGIELHRPHARANRLGMMAGIDIRQRQTVIEKRHLDFAVLQCTRDALVVFRRKEIQDRRRVAPRPRQIGAVLSLQKGDQRHHAVLRSHGNSLRSIGNWRRVLTHVNGGRRV